MSKKHILIKILGVLIFFTAVYFLTKYSLLKWGSLRIESDATITVKGTYTQQITNQVATYNIGISSTKQKKEDAVSEVKTRSDNLVNALLQYGIDTKDIQTMGMSVYQREEPYYEDGVQRFRKTDWIASTNLSVALRDITKQQDFSDKVYSMDVSDLSGPYFSLDFNTDNDIQILKQALANVETKARALATSQNKTLGEVVSIKEDDSSSGSPVPVMLGGKGMGGGAGGGAQAGSSSITKSVTVTYKIY